MSSSAALESTYAFALNDMYSLNIDKFELAKIGQATEHNYCGVNCGIMWLEKWDGLPSEEFLTAIEPKLAGFRSHLYKDTYTSDTKVGYLTEEWAKKLGLTTNVAVAVGAFDCHMPEFLEKRYNSQSRTILSVISLVSYVLTKVAVTVYAGGLVFKEVFGIQELWGIDFFWIAAIGLVLLTAIYTVIGGMKSVLYTSVLQTPILLLGSIVILVLGLKAVGGWDQVLATCGSTAGRRD